MKKPKNVKLHRSYELRAADKGRSLIYLWSPDDTNHGCWEWIEGRRKIKAMHKFLTQVLEWSKP